MYFRKPRWRSARWASFTSGPNPYPRCKSTRDAGFAYATLNGPAIGLLDSIMPRGEDTLLYLSARGQFLPVTVSTSVALGGLPATAELWGQFTSRLIWSTGWNAFVSMVLTARVYQRFEVAEESGGHYPRLRRRFQGRPWG